MDRLSPEALYLSTDEPFVDALRRANRKGPKIAVLHVAEAAAARRILAASRFHVILADVTIGIAMTGGLDFLEHVRGVSPLERVALADVADYPTAFRAKDIGATLLPKMRVDFVHLVGQILALAQRSRMNVSQAPSTPRGVARREQVRAAVERHNGNRSAAAREIGITRQHVLNLLKK